MTPQLLHEITGGHKTVPTDWMPSTGTRNLILEDPCLIWLDFHGKSHGFEKDHGSEYSLSDFIMSAGRDFESNFIKNVCPEAEQALRDDRDVRRVTGLLRTIELIEARAPVITHAALWNAKYRIYGAADIIVLASWFFAKFPHLQPAKYVDSDDLYLVIDLKMTSKLTSSAKAKAFKAYSAQVRLYSFMLGHITGHMPTNAYLITKDRHDDPITVEVTSKLGKPLDADLCELRDRFLNIKLNGATKTPWDNEELEPLWSNARNAPWAGAVEQIALEKMSGRPLEWLPRVGQSQAKALRALGYSSLDEILKVNPDDLPLESVKGLNSNSARQIRAVLKANRSHEIAKIPAHLVPIKHNIELFVDYEFFPNLNIHYDEDPWPSCLDGRELIFMVGLGWLEGKHHWHYKQFTAAQETLSAEKDMFEEFLQFLEDKAVFKKDVDAAIYCYSKAELWQSERAAHRTGLARLRGLPWVDLQETVLELPLGVPGAWDFGLKSVFKAIAKEKPEYALSWPSGLSNGAAASCVGFKMFEAKEPLKTKEFELLSDYLEVDCHSLERVLSYLRDSSEKQRKASQTYDPPLTGGNNTTQRLPSDGWHSTLAIPTPAPNGSARNNKVEGWYGHAKK